MFEGLVAGLTHWTTLGLEAAGILVIVFGSIVSSAQYLKDRWQSADRYASFQSLRSSLGRYILLGLEFLVAADIINTVAVEPTLQSLAVLAGIVLIRTFLSFSLEVEIEGRWPWERKQDSDRSAGPTPPSA